jgi:CSLREA domain-containing protein
MRTKLPRNLEARLTVSWVLPLLLGTGVGGRAQADVHLTVNTTVDEPDQTPGDGICASAAARCSLRAAVEESNGLVGTDRITVPEGNYPLTRQLVLVDDVSIEGAGKGRTVLDGRGMNAILHVSNVDALVTDSGDDSVRAFLPSGGNTGRVLVASGAGGLRNAISAKIVGDDLLVSGFFSGLHRYDPDSGAFRGMVLGPSFGPFTDMAEPPGSFPLQGLYLAEFGLGGRVLRIDPVSGAVLGSLPTPTPSSLPNSLAFHDGNLLVSDAGTGNVLRYSGTDGAYLGVLIPKGRGGLDTPRGLAVKAGQLYVANDDVLGSVLVYDADDGAFVRTFVALGSGGLDGPADLVFGPDSDLYVTSGGTRQILRYDRVTGAFKGVFVQAGSSSGSRPSGVFFRYHRRLGQTVSLQGLAIANGLSSGAGDTSGLSIDPNTTVTLIECSVRDNASNNQGGGIRNFGNLTLLRSEVRNNSLPTDFGGGVTSTGGGILNATGGTLRVFDSLIADNVANRGGGIGNRGRAEIRNSTISGNRAIGAGGGIHNIGQTSISYSTITNNGANQPGGDGGEPNRFGGGFANIGDAALTIGKSIVAGNRDGRSPSDAGFSPDCYASTAMRALSRRDNLIGILTNNCLLRDFATGTTAFMQVGTPLAPLDAGLDPLGDNGGPTDSHALRADSPALDGAPTTGDPADFFVCPGVDQHGRPRPVDGDLDGQARCDAGSYERQLEAGADTDGDGLDDRTESEAGTDPRSRDSDGDGIDDPDDFDTIGGVYGTLPEAVFRSRPHRLVIGLELQAAQLLARIGRPRLAALLLTSLRGHADGCGGTPPAADQEDWIVECGAQDLFRRVLDPLRSSLGE